MESRAYLMADSQPRGLLSPRLDSLLRRLLRPLVRPFAVVETYSEGADISHWQGQIRWDILRSKTKFVYMKATEGLYYVDPTFGANMTNSAAPGYLRGAFHFLRPDDGEAQLLHLLDVCREVGTMGELPIMVDVEVPMPDAVLRDFVYATIDNLGYYPVVYGSKRTLNELLYGDKPEDRTWLRLCPLMVAGWGTSAPRIPLPWTEWVIHQYDVRSDGVLYGVSSTRLDHDRAKDSWLNQYRQPVPPPPEPEPPPEPIDEETDMSELTDKVDELIAKYGTPLPFDLNVNLNVAVGAPGPTPPPPPPPPPVVTKTYTVKSVDADGNAIDKSCAYQISDYNNSSPDVGGPFPIMLMVSTELRSRGQPFKNTPGQTVKVYPEPRRADGGKRWWIVYGVTNPNPNGDYSDELFLDPDRGTVS